jgi:hypothetical protein
MTNKKEEYFYFTNEIRKEIRENLTDKVKDKNYKEDSHTSVVSYFGLTSNQIEKIKKSLKI